jgi:hypothetical protein
MRRRSRGLVFLVFGCFVFGGRLGRVCMGRSRFGVCR